MPCGTGEGDREGIASGANVTGDPPLEEEERTITWETFMEDQDALALQQM